MSIVDIRTVASRNDRSWSVAAESVVGGESLELAAVDAIDAAVDDGKPEEALGVFGAVHEAVLGQAVFERAC